MIEVRGPNVFTGYWNMPEKTAEEFEDGFFITGDLGQLDKAGYVQIVGRSKDLIISGGYNIYKRLSCCLMNRKVCWRARWLACHILTLAKVLLACWLPSLVLPRYKAISAAIHSKIARFNNPSSSLSFPNFLNTMGKVQKNVLRNQYADVF